MKITKATVYFPSGAIKYTVGKTCTKIFVDPNSPVLIIHFGVKITEHYNTPFSVEYKEEEI